jgi:hypothetical protein
LQRRTMSATAQSLGDCVFENGSNGP